MDNLVVCNNCGMIGHIYRECRNPVSSFGIIIFRKDKIEPQILMVQRKNSLCYIEFLRGKYNINNKEYIINLLTKCSVDEKISIKTKNFDELWVDLWTIGDKLNIEIKDYLKKDYLNGKEKFLKIKPNLDNLLTLSKNIYENSEWEFPKGRRNRNETNLDTAIREFREETGYNNDDYTLFDNMSPVTEEYRSNNNVNYRHIYNIGYLKNINKEIYVDKDNLIQASEIKDIKWFTKNEALEKIRDYHVYRKKLIIDIFDMIDKTNNEYEIIT